MVPQFDIDHPPPFDIDHIPIDCSSSASLDLLSAVDTTPAARVK